MDVLGLERLTPEMKGWNFFSCFYCHLIELGEWALKTYFELLAFSAYPPASLLVLAVLHLCQEKLLVSVWLSTPIVMLLSIYLT